MGAGKRPETLHCRRDALPGLVDKLTKAIGELRRFEVTEVGEPSTERPEVVAQPVVDEFTERLIVEAAMDDVSTPEVLEEIARMAVNDETPEPVERIVGKLVATQASMTVSASAVA